MVSFLDERRFLRHETSMRNTFFILQIVNTTIDPVLYAFKLQELRACYLDVFNPIALRKAKMYTILTFLNVKGLKDVEN